MGSVVREEGGGLCVCERRISLENEAKKKFNNVLLSFCFKAIC